MPDEISHLLWTYLVLRHPRVKGIKDFQSKKGLIATYFFTILPDLGNLAMALALMWVMASHNLPFVAGPEALKYPEVSEAFTAVRSIYYIFHSYVTYVLLIILFYIILGRIYMPLLLGMGLAITMDIPTHRDLTSLEPFYPLSDYKVEGFLHWGSWEFYTLELLLLVIYTIWLFRKSRR